MAAEYYYYRSGKIHKKSYDDNGKLLNDFCFNVSQEHTIQIMNDITKAVTTRQKQSVLRMWYLFYNNPQNERIDFIDYADRQHFLQREANRNARQH